MKTWIVTVDFAGSVEVKAPTRQAAEDMVGKWDGTKIIKKASGEWDISVDEELQEGNDAN